MKIGTTKREKKRMVKKEKQLLTTKQRNRENISGMAANCFYSCASTSEVIKNTLNTCATTYDVFFNYYSFKQHFIVFMNRKFLYFGTFHEMENKMHIGIKSCYFRFWEELVTQKLHHR